MKTVWDKLAIRTLRRIVEYIQIDSEEAAKKVYDTIVSQTRTLYLFPNKLRLSRIFRPKKKPIGSLLSGAIKSFIVSGKMTFALWMFFIPGAIRILCWMNVDR